MTEEIRDAARETPGASEPVTPETESTTNAAPGPDAFVEAAPAVEPEPDFKDK